MLPGTDAAPLAFRRQLSAPALLRLSLDAVIAVGSLLAIASYFGKPFEGPYLILALIVFSLTFPGAVYNPRTVLGLARDVLLNWFIVLLILLFFGYASGYLSLFPARMVLAWSVTVPVLVFIGHATIPYLLPKVLAIEGMRRNAVIAGGNELGAKLVQQIHGAPLLGIQVAAVFDDRNMERRAKVDGVPTLGKLSALAEYVKSHHVDLIYITLPMASQPRILNLLESAARHHRVDLLRAGHLHVRPDPGARRHHRRDAGGRGVRDAVLRLQRRDQDAQRLRDRAPRADPYRARSCWPSPPAIKLDSPGPVLFKQRRYGLDGREITVYKFRTMTVLEDGGEVRQATQRRQAHHARGAAPAPDLLDELPQFINVLQGSMSVVGPRPHAVAHNETYRKLIDGYMVRHKVRPGITGWAQVNGFRGETDTVEKMKQRIEYDLTYLRNWSLRLDLHDHPEDRAGGVRRPQSVLMQGGQTSHSRLEVTEGAG